MCGRYSWSQKKALPKPINFILPPSPKNISYNRAPGQVHPVIIEKNRNPAWASAVWGLESANQSSKVKFNPINARIETVNEKAAFQSSIAHRRCLVPADGYFEWQKMEKQRYPHFHFLINKNAFSMAGIWNINCGKLSFAVLTQPASSNLLHIHHRMPVIIKPEDWNSWLNPDSDLHILLTRYREAQVELNFHQVSSRVNRVKENDIKIIEQSNEKQSTLW